MSAYNELIKNFEKIRSYMRDFYVYGFKTREDYDRKSLRSYDNERRRVESWLGEYMRFSHTAQGKTVFLSIDTRRIRHNPLYRAWKACSFTDGDIALHFILFDILDAPDTALSFTELIDEIDAYGLTRTFDESTVRKKLKEYVAQGLIVRKTRGRTPIYHRAEDPVLPPLDDALHFFSEIAPCGVVGSFLLDKGQTRESPFSFKHHYLTDAPDSDVLAEMFSAMREKRSVRFVLQNRHGRTRALHAVPLCIFISVQNGRQHLLAYRYDVGEIYPFRVDHISDVTADLPEPQFDRYRELLDAHRGRMWGVNLRRHAGRSGEVEHVEFVVRASPDERHIVARLLRERRVGTVEALGEGRYRFSADVYDSMELVPWMRTFICRIERFSFSNRAVERRFADDLETMYRMYDVGEEDADDLQ
ncbi:MAG: WYL domain-containing protein [Clostridia bacterium]|nr:WYL domain-containing protein [Clostridia bacterium]